MMNNLFKRGRSTTGKGASAFDGPSSNRANSQNNDSKSQTQSTPSTAQDSLNFPYSGTSISETSASSRIPAYRGGDELWPTQSSSQRPSSPRTLVTPKSSATDGFTSISNDSELYSQNYLSTFTFGAAQSSHSPSSITSIDPLTRPNDETDSDDIQLYPDTTPRPSVVGQGHPNGHSMSEAKPEQRLPSTSRFQSPPRDNSRDAEIESDVKSLRTNGHSSASASVSSFSRPSGSDSRSTSRVSSRSSTTPQTSGVEFTSSEDEADLDDRHPLPPDSLDGNELDFPQPRDTLYLSEEELDIYGDEEDADHEDLQDLQNPPTASTVRRGSAAIAIPNSTSDRLYNDHRDSPATLRRASKSLDELFTYNFAKASVPSSASRSSGGTAIAPVAPSSVPESEVDLENVRKKSLPPITPTANPTVTISGMDQLGIDSTWMEQFGRDGLVNLDNSMMADIVGESSLGRRQSDFNNYRKGSTASTMRRHSTFSNTTIDIIMKNIHVWNAEDSKYQDQKRLWVYEQERERLEPPLPTARERPSISSFFSPRSTAPLPDPNAGLIAPFLEPNIHSRDRAREKAAKNWKGMPLDTDEVWANGWSGRFRVSRKNTEDPTKIQQRINFQCIRSQNGTDRVSFEGPPVTVHKHSKAVAFSIGRHYRSKTRSRSHGANHLDNISRHNGQNLTVVEPDKKKGGMILLAPRHVQVSYTSTTTTRKLELHGLLDDGRSHSKDAERLRREREREKERIRAKERERAREKDKGRDKGKEKEKETDHQTSKDPRERSGSKSYSGKGKEKEVVGAEVWSLWEGSKEKTKVVESRESRGGKTAQSISFVESPGKLQDSSTSRKTNDTEPAKTSAEKSVPSAVPSTSSTSIAPTLLAAPRDLRATSQASAASSSSHTLVSSASRQALNVIEDEDEEDEDDELFNRRKRQPTRTTYREDYATLPPEAFELARQEQQSRGLFPWGRLKNNDKRNVLNAAYNPPWPVAHPRYNSETRKYIVEDLNMSFQDVGLLPAVGEMRTSSHAKSRQKKEQKAIKAPSNESRVDIFAEVPPDALYMILPLWPSDTDPSSAKRHPFTMPVIPVQDRQYLLVYYKTDYHHTPQRDGRPTKKRSRNSPTSSHDSVNRQDERYVLLNTFHISARVVSYGDLQGTSMRIPEVGLAVSGPLQDAYETMPPIPLPNHFDDYVLGICHSRSSGFEFFPEGFEKIGLSQNVLNPRLMELSTDDDDRSSMDTLAVPTPMGRAVMEMAWLGGMALTSFHRDPHWKG